MSTSIETMNKILNFYSEKKNIYNMKMEYIDSREGKRFMMISYYRDRYSRPINKLDISIIWKENGGEWIKSEENCIAMRNQENQFGVFQYDELEFFDRLGMKICDEASHETGQFIEDWWGAKQKV